MKTKKWPFRKVKEDQAQFILEQYLEGMGTKAIGGMLPEPVSSPIILKVLHHLEVPIRKTRNKERKDESGCVIHDHPHWPFMAVPPLKARQAKELYESGKMLSDIGEIIGVSPTTVNRVLRSIGVSLRGVKDKCVDIDTNAFTDLSDPETAYWFGWLLSDGCLSPAKLGTPTVSIALKRGDREVLERYCKYLGLPHERVKDYEFYVNTSGKYYEMTRVSFSNHIISERLMRLGMTPRKSTEEICPNIFKLNRHFWRGYFEGDGWISDPATYRSGARVQIVGGKTICEQWVDYCKFICPNVRVSIYPQKKEGSDVELFLTYSGKREEVKEIMDSLYQGVPEHLRLKRKYERYLGWFYPELLKDKTE